MNIWLINHYAVPIQYYPLARTTNFAKYLMRKGHEVTIFAASSVHNSTVNLIRNGELFRAETVDGIHYVYIKCRSYAGNGLGRIINMFEFAMRIDNVCKNFPKPDAVVATSMMPLACMEGLRLAKKYNAKAIAEITDLLPESLIAFGLISKSNPLLIPMYWFEKKMYEYADNIIFSLGGAYDYIEERGWTGNIPRSKVYYINNGVDLEVFDYNKEHYAIDDEDLHDDGSFKVIYTGSIRLANGLGKLVDVAKLLKNPHIKLLIWGKGSDLPNLRKRVEEEKIRNIFFKGYVDKKYVPYITTHADLNIVHYADMPVGRFGVSPNKLFDYMAAGKPILDDRPCKYNPLIECEAGVEVENPTPLNIAHTIERFADMNAEMYEKYCRNARRGAEKYDFKNLTKQLLEIMEK